MQLHHPRHRDSQGQETFLVASADKQTRNYYTECSNHHPTLSTLSSKGLSCSKMKWWSIYYKFTSKCHSETTPSSEWIYIYYIYIYIYIYIYENNRVKINIKVPRLHTNTQPMLLMLYFKYVQSLPISFTYLAFFWHQL